MKWLEMDIRDLKFDDATFDVIIDKGSESDLRQCEEHSRVKTTSYSHGRDPYWRQRCLGEHALPKLPVRSTLNLFPQNPPQDVVDSCDSEVREAIRWVCCHFLFWNNIDERTAFSNLDLAFFSTLRLRSHTSAGSICSAKGQPSKCVNSATCFTTTFLLCARSSQWTASFDRRTSRDPRRTVIPPNLKQATA